MLLRYFEYIYINYGIIRPLIELSLIGFAVYSVIRFLRGTGGEKLFMGFIFLVLGFWCVSFMTEWLALERIQLLFKFFLLMVLIVATVSFQPELRRGLMRLGGTRFGRNTMPDMANAIEQIVDAAAILSRSEIGAIIALEREVGLADYIANGTPINGEVTADLLTTIFWPGSPLHDMGVVIRKGKMAAAGVQFPLAEYGDFDRMLGSRHRAAIGLSRATDAAIVVVSEETGTISLAHNGNLARFLTLEQLRQQLLDMMLSMTGTGQDDGNKNPVTADADGKDLPLTDGGNSQAGQVQNLWVSSGKKGKKRSLPSQPKPSEEAPGNVK